MEKPNEATMTAETQSPSLHSPLEKSLIKALLKVRPLFTGEHPLTEFDEALAEVDQALNAAGVPTC